MAQGHPPLTFRDLDQATLTELLWHVLQNSVIIYLQAVGDKSWSQHSPPHGWHLYPASAMRQELPLPWALTASPAASPAS